MANTDNKCAELEIEDLYSQSNDTLGDILNLQAETQKNVYGYDFENMTLRDVMDFWNTNTHAIIDEIHEATDALGGIEDGDGSAIWKKWKKAYATYDTKKFSDLSQKDQLECKFEIIDMLHFFMNYAASIGMTPQEMYNMYMSKNKENRRRQEAGY
jgi:phosphopantothenate synthetase